MRTSRSSCKGAGDGYQAVDLPYAGHELPMTVIIPGHWRFEAFEASLDAAVTSGPLGPR